MDEVAVSKDTSLDPFAAWSFDRERTLVRQSCNEVFHCRKRGENFYARVTFLDHRPRNQIEAELAWMQALHATGVNVVALVPADDGVLLHETSYKGKTAFCVVTKQAPGRVGRKPDDLQRPVIEAWARLLAAFHEHARHYRPPASLRRPAWHLDPVLQTALQADDESTRWAQECLHHAVSWMRELPQTPATYGITHADLHLGNMAIEATPGGATMVTAFDFDDACEQFFVHDLAVAVTSLRKAAWECNMPDADGLVGPFLEAYASAGNYDAQASTRLERFVAYRIALSTCWGARCQTTGALDRDMTAWFAKSLPWWRGQLLGIRW